LNALYAAGGLDFFGQAQELQDQPKFWQLLGLLYKKEWVVYAKQPFGWPAQVVNYLGRYTHRIAISNRRIQQVDQGKVTFLYKDYRKEGQEKSMTLGCGGVYPQVFAALFAAWFSENPVFRHSFHPKSQNKTG